jgi:hypothetical protein
LIDLSKQLRYFSQSQIPFVLRPPRWPAQPRTTCGKLAVCGNLRLIQSGAKGAS